MKLLKIDMSGDDTLMSGEIFKIDHDPETFEFVIDIHPRKNPGHGKWYQVRLTPQEVERLAEMWEKVAP